MQEDKEEEERSHHDLHHLDNNSEILFWFSFPLMKQPYFYQECWAFLDRK
jgi:hypothetical protein